MREVNPPSATNGLSREQVLDTARALFQHYGWNNANDIAMRERIEKMRDMALSALSETPRMTAKERIAAVRADQAGEPISANQAGMALAQLGRTRLDAMADRFLSWPLPASVCADGCTTNRDYPHPRSGTNLLTAVEARQMLEHVLSGASAPSAIGTRDAALEEAAAICDQQAEAWQQAHNEGSEILAYEDQALHGVADLIRTLKGKS